ncbi:RICIN domain-containing protein [Candidatus Sumerlaeota bacterium]|nr:RICIN domain-containing protein [Candidatus Sumerlaeota bacterium]
MMRRIAVAMAVSLVFLAAVDTIQAQVGNNQTITNRASGRVLDAYGNSNGSNVIIYSNYNTSNQRWNVAALSNGYSIRSYQSGNLAMDTWNWGTSNGTNIALYSYWGGAPQKYFIASVGSGYYRITPSISTGQCVDAYGTANESNVGTWSYWGGSNQQWAFSASSSGLCHRNEGTVYQCGGTGWQPGQSGWVGGDWVLMHRGDSVQLCCSGGGYYWRRIEIEYWYGTGNINPPATSVSGTHIHVADTQGDMVSKCNNGACTWCDQYYQQTYYWINGSILWTDTERSDGNNCAYNLGFKPCGWAEILQQPSCIIRDGC